LSELFHQHRPIFDLIANRKLWALTSLKISSLTKYEDKSYLIRMNKVLSFVSADDLDRLLKANINPHLITPLNKSDLICLLDMRESFESRSVCIQWGPGNHGDPDLNLERHWHKHVEPDNSERPYWSKVLPDLTDPNSYGSYAVESFYQMTDVMVHTSGVGAHLSGFVGNIFIVGRLDHQVFGLSSAYVVLTSDKKGGRMKTKCFDLAFS